MWGGLLSHYAKCHEMPFCMRSFYENVGSVEERDEWMRAGEREGTEGWKACCL